MLDSMAVEQSGVDEESLDEINCCKLAEMICSNTLSVCRRCVSDWIYLYFICDLIS